MKKASNTLEIAKSTRSTPAVTLTPYAAAVSLAGAEHFFDLTEVLPIDHDFTSSPAIILDVPAARHAEKYFFVRITPDNIPADKTPALLIVPADTPSEAGRTALLSVCFEHHIEHFSIQATEILRHHG